MNAKTSNAWNKICLLVMLHYAHQKSDLFVDNLRIQKTAFIAEIRGREKQIKTAYYPFFRYTYGPYSKVLARDVALLEGQGFIDTESRMLTDRGKYLYSYVRPELSRSEIATEALSLAETVGKELRPLTSSKIVDLVYGMRVPVDGLGDMEFQVRDIPMNTDILIPSTDMKSRDIDVLDEMLVQDIEAELGLSPDDLDPANEGFRNSVQGALQRALEH